MHRSVFFVCLLLIAASAAAQSPERVQQSGHQSSLESFDVKRILSNDMQYIVTYDLTGHFKLWDRRTTRLIRNMNLRLQGPQLVSSVFPYFSNPTLSSDNNHLVTEGNSNYAAYSVWNTNTGKIESTTDKDLYGETMVYNLAVFGGDGMTLLTHGVNKKKNQFEIAAGPLNNPAEKIFNYERPLRIGGKKTIASEHNKEWRASVITCSSEKDHIAIGTTDGRIYIFNTRRLKNGLSEVLIPETQLILDTFVISRLCFSADGTILTAGSKANVAVWNIKTGRQVRSYTYPSFDLHMGSNTVPLRHGYLSGECRCMVIQEKESPSGKDNQTHQQFIRLPSGEKLREYLLDTLRNSPTGHMFIYYNDDMTEDGQTIVSGTSQVIRFLDPGNNNPDEVSDRSIVMEKNAFITTATLDPTNNDLYLGRLFNDAILFNLSTGRMDYLRKFVYTPDTAGRGTLAEQYDLDESQDRNLLMSPDNKYILSWDLPVPIWHKRKAIIWERQTGTVKEWIDPDLQQTENDPVKILDHAKDSRWKNIFLPPARFSWQLSQEGNGEKVDGMEKQLSTITILDGHTGKKLTATHPYGSSVYTTDYGRQTGELEPACSDGQKLYVGMQNGSVLVLALPSGKQLMTLQKTQPFERPASSGVTAFNPVQAMRLDQQGRYLYVARYDSSNQSFVAKYDVTTGAVVMSYRGHNRIINSITVHPNNKVLITTAKDRTARFWDITTGAELATLTISGHDYLLSTPEGYYMASRKGAATTHYVSGKTVYLFEQFDLRYNRPDIVLKKLGFADDQVIKDYRKAYDKRVSRAGFDPGSFDGNFLANAPVIHLNDPGSSQTHDKEYKISMFCEDRLYPLKNIQVQINGVPVFGESGIDLSGAKTKTADKTLSIPLTPGRNIIQVSVFNEKGVESLRETKEVQADLPGVKRTLYVVMIGAAKYKNAKMNLDYAAKDATDLGTMFNKTPAGFSDIKKYILLDSQVSRNNIRQIFTDLKKATIDDRLIVFYAGHGLFDTAKDYYLGTYALDFTRPGNGGMLFSEMEQLLTNIPARDKIFFVDACHSGEVDKSESEYVASQKTEQGLQKMRSVGDKTLRSKQVGLENSFELMKESFADISRHSGISIVAAARGGEFAMEGGGLKNGVFTWCILNGLTGSHADANGDGKIFLSELQTYLEANVPVLTKGRQRPTTRAENLVKDFQVY